MSMFGCVVFLVFCSRHAGFADALGGVEQEASSGCTSLRKFVGCFKGCDGLFITSVCVLC